MKTTITAIAAGLALLLFPGASGAAVPAAAADACETPHDFESFRVEIVPVTASVQRRETAVVRATVYRSLNGDDLAPAEGAKVVVALWRQDFVRVGGATTDHHGNATVRIRLNRGFPTGWAHASAHATREPAELPCDPLREAGGTTVQRFIKVL